MGAVRYIIASSSYADSIMSCGSHFRSKAKALDSESL